ncbi:MULTISPECIES: hypothetical protein [Mucilaginibacter]|nr:hypothetical protein [Mucilaginibacter flavidus]MCO5946150.1 hypothetical protein [Mucilaginibacter flavidus]
MNIKFLIGGAVVTPILLLIVAGYFIKKGDGKLLAYKFNGRVDSVRYSDHSVSVPNVTGPFVTIKGKTYHLFYHTWNFGYKIQKGDSIIKNENTLVVTLIKKSGKKFVYGGD